MVDVGRAVITVSAEADQSSLSGLESTFRDRMARVGRSMSRAGRGLTVGLTAPLVGLAAAGTLAAEQLDSKITGLSTVLGNLGQEGATGRLAALADEQERLLGVDEKVIIANQTMLASFKSVGKTAGETGGIMDRASVAALDISAAVGESSESISKGLGRALEDPVKGLSALSRSGITFTDQQRDMVKALVESGNQLGAQKFILSEIESIYGGAAEETADASEKMRLALGEVGEELGDILLPLVESAAGRKVLGARDAGYQDGHRSAWQPTLQLERRHAHVGPAVLAHAVLRAPLQGAGAPRLERRHALFGLTHGAVDPPRQPLNQVLTHHNPTPATAALIASCGV